ncbi:MAG: SUMF1/EgtB/PvdO family nonheme iron enzyme, partial [Planctomycetota bacterium]
MENHQVPGFETRAIFGAPLAESPAAPVDTEPVEVPPLSVVTRELPSCPPAPAAQAAPESQSAPPVSPVPTGAAPAPDGTAERPFVLPNGEGARTGRELLQVCFKFQQIAEGPLYDGQIEAWLADRGERGLYERARRVRLYCNDRRAGVLEFLRGKRPLMLPDGRFLFSPEEFRLWAWKNPEPGKELLYGGQVIHWLDASGHRDLAERARKVVGTMSPGTRSLCAFLSERVYKTLFREPERLHVSAAPPCPDGMVFVPAGTYMMGLSDGQVEELARRYPQWRPEWFESERPAHKAVVSAFFLDVSPVTNRQYLEFVRATGYPAPSHWQRREKTMETR